MKISLKILLCGLLTIAFTACKEESPDEPIMPGVRIDNCVVDGNTVSFGIVPENAVTCAYTYYKKGEKQLTAEQVLTDASSVKVASDSWSLAEIKDLEWETDYVVAAAAVSESGLYALASKDVTTAKYVPEVPDEPDEPGVSKDLGAGANCYVVPKKGEYFFTPSLVSGKAVEGIASVKWVWASKVLSDKQDLVEDVEYKDGRIYFTATGKKGNVSLAALDENDRVVWSWHIWCTDEPKTCAHANGSVFQDRWLGATDNTPNAAGSFGLLYQWGRKDPFFGGTDANDCEEYNEPPFAVATKNTVMNPELKFKWEARQEAVDIAGSVKEPTTLFSRGMLDWMSVQDDKLWGKEKTDYDPCPAGYRVPTADELADLRSVAGGDYNIAKGGFSFANNGESVWWQGSGNRDPQGYLTILGQLFAWSSDVQVYPDGSFSTRYLMNDDWGCFVGIGNRSFAQSVRCVSMKSGK